jgi:hypothetical protein
MPFAQNLPQEAQAEKTVRRSKLAEIRLAESGKHAAINEWLRSEQNELAAIREKLLNQSRVAHIQRAANAAHAEQAIRCICYQRAQLNERLRSERSEIAAAQRRSNLSAGSHRR